MSITIRGDDRGRLCISGDINVVIDLPNDCDDRFLVALSDGTLLEGNLADDQTSRLSVLSPGAAIIEGYKSGPRQGVTVHWDIEWLNVGRISDSGLRQPEDQGMPLFDALGLAQGTAADCTPACHDSSFSLGSS